MCDGRKCVTCGECRKIKAHGMCNRCASYYRRNGTMRPDNPNANRNKHPCCLVCGRDRTSVATRGGHGLCSRCYSYRLRNGKDWTPDIARRRPSVAPPICDQCGCRPSRYTKPKNLCLRCYNYWNHTGRHRPKWRDADECMNCHAPRMDGQGQFVKGRCKRCYSYWLNHEKKAERPERFWQRGKYGYCDCGKPAAHSATIRIFKRTEHLPLCDGCYAEHQRQVSWYGSPDIVTKGNIQPQRKSAKLYGDD